MSITEALEILESLAKGVSPYTGKEFPQKSALRKSKTKKALKIAIKHLSKSKELRETILSDSGLPENHGKSWQPSDIADLKSDFKAGTTELIKELATIYGRTPRAIVLRLIDCRVLPDNDFFIH